MNTIEMLKELVENGGMYRNTSGGIVSIFRSKGVAFVREDGTYLSPLGLEMGVLEITWKPYVKPVDWSKVPIDTRVLCITRLGWVPMHYAGLSDKGKPTVWDAGRTSYTTKDRVSGWDEIKLAEDVPCSR